MCFEDQHVDLTLSVWVRKVQKLRNCCVERVCPVPG